MDCTRESFVLPCQQHVGPAHEIQQPKDAEVAESAAVAVAQKRGNASALRGSDDDRNGAVVEAMAQVQGRAEADGIVADADIHTGDVRLAAAAEEEVRSLEFGRVEIHAVGPHLAHAGQAREALVQQGNPSVGRKIDGRDLELLAAHPRNGTPAASGMHDEPGAHLAEADDHDVRRAQGSLALGIEWWVVREKRRRAQLGHVEVLDARAASAASQPHLSEHVGELVVHDVNEARQRRAAPHARQPGGGDGDVGVPAVVSRNGK